MRVLTVVGARPQFVKASVVSVALASRRIDEVLVHTGQHFDENMSAVFFEELGIAPPAVDLGVRATTHATMTAEMLVGIEAEIVRAQPDVVLVYGDTNSTLAGALAAAKLVVPVAHVEAGLRSFNRRMPEEVNRVLTDHVADLLFAPSSTAVENLAAEGLSGDSVVEVGDVMYDVARRYSGIATERGPRVLESAGIADRQFVLATVHRAENTDDPERLAAILAGLDDVARHDVPVVLPLHPRTRAALGPIGTGAVTVIDPVGYLDMVQLEMSAAVVCTDSGGVQKEAFFHGVPCVTIRDETEWVELVDLGWNRLVPPVSGEAVAAGVRAALAAGPGRSATVYGTGDSASLVADALVERFGR